MCTENSIKDLNAGDSVAILRFGDQFADIGDLVNFHSFMVHAFHFLHTTYQGHFGPENIQPLIAVIGGISLNKWGLQIKSDETADSV